MMPITLYGLMPRTASLLIGYIFGSFLTAVFVVKIKTGKDVSEFGTGNPGMANVMTQFGKTMGILVLAGDLLKTILACMLSLFLFGGSYISDPYMNIGQICILWTGVGAVIGHNWPLWRKLSGGKGVAVTCCAIILYSPLWGILSGAAGMLVVFSTGFLPLGAVVISTLFMIFAFLFCSVEAGILAAVLEMFMLIRHAPGLLRMIQGKEEKNAQLFFKSRSGKTEPGQNPAETPADNAGTYSSGPDNTGTGTS